MSARESKRTSAYIDNDRQPLLSGAAKSEPTFYSQAANPIPETTAHCSAYTVAPASGVALRRYFLKRFVFGSLLFGFFAYVSTVPYLKLSEKPMNLLNQGLSRFVEALLYFAVYDSTFINGLMLYPRSTVNLFFTLLNLLSALLRFNLRLPFFTCWKGMKLTLKYQVFLMGSAFAGFSAFLAAQIFRNALDSLDLENWIKLGMVACRLAIIFIALMNWVEKIMGSVYFADTNRLREQVNELHKLIIKHELNSIYQQSPTKDNLNQQTRRRVFDEFLFSSMHARTYQDYLTTLVDHVKTQNYMAATPKTRSTCLKNILLALEAFAVISISVFATTGQYLGVMAYYNIPAFGYIALFAICFGLYCDNVKKALEAIFNKENYEKSPGLIFRQVITAIGGACSGLPSVAVILAANSVQGKGKPLLDSPIASWVETVMTYLNGALLNGLACFKSLADLVWWYKMLRGIWCLSTDNQEQANLDSYALGFKIRAERLESCLTHFYLSRQNLAEIRSYMNDSFQWDDSFSRPLTVSPLSINAPLPHEVRVLTPALAMKLNADSSQHPLISGSSYQPGGSHFV